MQISSGAPPQRACIHVGRAAQPLQHMARLVVEAAAIRQERVAVVVGRHRCVGLQPAAAWRPPPGAHGPVETAVSTPRCPPRGLGRLVRRRAPLSMQHATSAGVALQRAARHVSWAHRSARELGDSGSSREPKNRICEDMSRSGRQIAGHHPRRGAGVLRQVCYCCLCQLGSDRRKLGLCTSWS